ncbi:PAS domain S-box-containing protein [Desulfonatronum thiosulfatophilum]|uniref:Sensory/regulatory protein RpfC n=1 Tax=Desulfonatronum thiosulfatophilum TaxID=617002 RepID=A0A1G6CME5_9BACT|nr:PAS domain S-box protein [Desulfonatronum thiosulfatophilum]SDB33905.1 PAS domain S-box-containing protein [Desulfonatronum thiosulfatophilum]
MYQKQAPAAPPAQAGFSDAQDILDHAPVGIFKTTPEGRFLYANQALAEMFGYNAPLDLVNSVQDIAAELFADPKDGPTVTSLLAAEGIVKNFECEHVRKDGTRFWASGSIRTVYAEDGSVLHFQGFVSDITARKNAEQAERETERRFRLMFKNAPMPYQSLDEQGNFLDVNQLFLDVLGYSRDELIDKNFGDILHPDWRDHFKENFPKFKAVGEILGVEFEMVKKDGSPILVYFNGKIQRDAQGRFQRTHCIFQDVTEKKQAEDALRESENRYLTLFERTINPITIIDIEGNYIDANEAALHFFECSRSELLTKNVIDYIPPGKNKMLATHLPLWETGGVLEREYFVHGRVKTLILTITSGTWHGRPVVFGNGIDITERKQTEEALQEDAVRRRILVDDSRDGIVVLNQDGSVHEANKRFAGMLGYSHEEIQQLSLWDWDINRDPDQLAEMVHKIDVKGDFFETRHRRKDGTFYDVEISSNGSVINGRKLIFCVCRDVTERKRIEHELKEKTALLEGILDNIPDIMGVKRPDLSVMRYNKAGYAFLNKSPEQVIGGKCYEHIGRKAPCSPCATQAAIQAKQPVELEKFVPELDVHLSCRANPILSDAGQVEYAVELIRDITQRINIEKVLRESEARFSNLFEHVPTVAVQGYGMDGMTLFWNKASENFYGYSADEAIGKNLLDLIIPDEMRQDVLREIQVMSAGGKPIPPTELSLKRKDGSRIQVYSSHAIINKFDQEPELFCIDIDLTELKRTEAAMLQAKQAAEAANLAKSEFLANMSHEIRTPINGIMGMMALLDTTALDEDQQQYVHLAKTSADRLTRLLSDILDLSKVEVGKMELLESEFSMIELQDSILGLFTVTARNKGMTLECSIDPAIPQRLVGDEARLRQVLFNVVGNSLKYSDSGKVNVRMTPIRSWKNGAFRILFSVTDTGIGIPDDKLNDLFKPFVQVDGSYTRKYQGAGLGLAIVKRLVELMDGRLCVESLEGRGTTIHIALYFKLPVANDSSLSIGASSSSPASRLRILLVEDDPSNSFPTMKLLQKAGHKGTLAENGRQALDLLSQQDFDLVLMDIQMPVMNGVEAAKAIRSSTDLGLKKDIPIIALTAYAMLGDREKFLDAGMNDYVGKPMHMEDLQRVLERTFA